MPIQWSFNANAVEPSQGLSNHPPALKIPFTITNTAMKENSAKTGGYLEVELTSPQGVMIARYNTHNPEPKAVEIAYGQLSALCHATGRFNLEGGNDCAALRGGAGLMDIAYQKGEDPATNPSAKGYTELKRVYDINGNDPSRPKAATPQAQQGFGGQPQAQQQQPQTQQGGPTPMTNQGGGSWGPSQQQAPQQPPQAQQQPQGQQGAWQPNAGGGQQQSPPWGQR